MSLLALAQLRKRLRRRRRRIVLGALVAFAFFGSLWALLVEGTLLRHAVGWTIGWRLDAICTIDEFRWNGWDRAEVTGISVRVKEWPDAASEAINVGSLRAAFDPLPLLWGRLALTDISIDRMTINAIERDDGAEVNLRSLVIPEARGGTGRQPRITIDRVMIRLGRLHSDTGLVEFNDEREMIGSVTSDRRVRNRWNITLSELNAEGREPLQMNGSISGNPFSYQVTLSNFTLDGPLGNFMPGASREIWRQMNLTGSIRRMEVSGGGGHLVQSALIEVSDLDLTLPDTGLENAWAVYQDEKIQLGAGQPRIHVREGVAIFEDWRLELKRLRGELKSSTGRADVVPLPVELSFVVDLDQGRIRDWNQFDAKAWAEESLEHAPFELRVSIPTFAIERHEGRAPPIELPRVAAEIFSNFMVKEGTISIDATVSRGPPIWRPNEGPRSSYPDEGPIAREISARGAISIKRGRGGYFKFPYELSDVSAHITLADDVVNVLYVRGRGSGNSEVTVSGTVLEPGDDAGVDLLITSDRVPIDQRLESGLQFSPAQRFLTLLFNRPAFDSLKASGILESTAAAMSARRAELLEEIRTLKPSTPVSEEDAQYRAGLSAEVRRLSASEWLGNFSPGGLCAMNLRVRRDIAGGDHVSTTGTITLIDAHAICEPLPYPLRVLGKDMVGAPSATITVEDERILLPEGGLHVQLAGGGSGRVAGAIDLPRTARGDREVIPRVTVTAANDAINPLLLAALPIDDPDGPIRGAHDGWPGANRSDAAEALDAIGLQGLLETALFVGSDGDGGISWTVDLELTEGSASPRKSYGGDLAESGIEWPVGFDLERCRARVHIDSSTAALESFEGWHRTGKVSGVGTIGLREGQRTLGVDFEAVPIGPYLVNLVPTPDRETIHQLWQSLRPEGVFDARLDWSVDRDGERHRELHIEPGWIAFEPDPRQEPDATRPHRVRIERQAGDLRIVDRMLEARAIGFRVIETSLPPSTLLVDGTYGSSPSRRRLEIGAAWTNARFESALLRQALALIDDPRVVEQWHEAAPRGGFNATMSYASGADDPARLWRVSTRIRDITATIDGMSTTVIVDPDSEPIVIVPRAVQFADLRGATENGRFALAGEIPLDAAAAPGRTLRVSYDGSRVASPELALFGRGARRALSAIEFVANGPVTLDDGVVHYGMLDGDIVTRFSGDVTLQQASFRAGVAFEQLDARVRVDIDPASESRVDIDAPHFVVFGRPVSRTRATVLVSSDGTRVEVPRLDGEIASGSASAGVTVRIDSTRADGGDYEVWFRLVGAQLSELPAHPPQLPPGIARDSSVASAATGRVDGELLVGGSLNWPDRRAGRGRVEIRDGRMAELPIALSLLQVSQLMLPLTTSLDRGDIRFHIDGERLFFERFDLTSPTIEFRGTGELDLETDQLALRFRNRGTVPVWRDLFGAVSDALFAIDVTGTLSDPSVSVAPLPPFNRAPVAARGEQP